MKIPGYKITATPIYCPLPGCGRRIWTQDRTTIPADVSATYAGVPGHKGCVALERAKRKHGVGTRPKPTTR